VHSADKQLLKEAGVATDGPALLAFIRSIRDKPKAPIAAEVTAAAVRVLAHRKPAGTVEVLLAHLPFAHESFLVEDIENALSDLAFPDGQPEPLLVRALDDKAPLCRLTAISALHRAGGRRAVPLIRPRLHDPDVQVQLRAAQSLAEAREQEAVPVLIALLVDLPADQAWQAETALQILAGSLAPNATLGSTDASRRACQDAWQRWWHANDGPALLARFRQWTPRETDPENVRDLTRRLGHDDYAIREQAMAALIQLGELAIPFLRRAATDSDLEIRYRSEACLRAIEKNQGGLQAGAVAQLLALRKPAGATEALLAFAPLADDAVLEDLMDALAVVGFGEGQAQAALRRALDDKLPGRRAAAAVALCRGGGTDDLTAVRRLLQDREPTVRLRVALALTDLRQTDGVPVLINLLNELPLHQAWQVEEVLHQLAGDKGPAVAVGEDSASRSKCHEAWTRWWREQGSQAAPADLVTRRPLRGYTMVVEWSEGKEGRIEELARNGKPRWQLAKIPWALDAQVLPGNRLLLAEVYEQRAAERNFQGALLWEKKVDSQPLAAQRLGNGNTFIVTTSQLLEVDRSGKEIVNVRRLSPLAARKLPDGRIACIASPNRFCLLDAAGKQLSTFTVGNFQRFTGFDVLPGDRVLVPLTLSNEIVEYDGKGQVLRKLSVKEPTSVERLPNGHTLVASRNTKQVVELDQGGKVVWEYKAQGYSWRAHRR
jgi:HEAT repeat protein